MLTNVGEQMSHLTGVRSIMKDIEATLRSAQTDLTGKNKRFINMSAGNPVIIPEVQDLWARHTQELTKSQEFGEVVCRYGSSKGYQPFIDAVLADFNQRYGQKFTAKNILVTPGSQSLYFLAANAFGGLSPDGIRRKIVLPLSPDYTGYAGVVLDPKTLIAFQPDLEIDAATHRFKYRPNFSTLQIGADTGMVLFSRPCNPTGNVMSAADVSKVAEMSRLVGAPLFIDSAYAPPYPALNFTEMVPVFGENIVHCVTLSKAGLPGERVGVAIGPESIISVLEAFQTNLCIHSSRYGQAIAARAIKSGELGALCEQIIRPHYQDKQRVVEATLDTEMPSNVAWRLHKGEGSIFAWLWIDGLPIDDWAFYQMLKANGVIVVPGSPFFPGLQQDWQHSKECIRISLTEPSELLIQGMQIIAQVTRTL